jgi:flavin-dependent dehydrogenase
MVIARHGYVGVSKIDEKQYNVAAAVAPRLLSRSSPRDVVRSMFQESGVSVPLALENATWRGTPPLTSCPRVVAGNRVFLIGDASGYVEPFTGEGMATALETGVAIAPFVAESAAQWTPSVAAGWTALHRRLVSDRQQTCRRLSWVLRRPWAGFTAMQLCRLFPSIARRVIEKTNASNPSRVFPEFAAI